MTILTTSLNFNNMTKETKQKNQLKSYIYWLIYIGVAVVAILIDQLTKHFLEAPLQNGDINIIGEWLTLHWTLNYGATGGMLQGKHTLFFIITLLGIPLFIFLMWYAKKRSVWGQIGFAFCLGGLFGNAIDRMFYEATGFFNGAVRDFIHVRGFFGIFNIADSFLVVGVILAVLALIFFDPDSLMNTLKENSQQKKEKATQEAQDNSDGETAENIKQIDTNVETKSSGEKDDEDSI